MAEFANEPLRDIFNSLNESYSTVSSVQDVYQSTVVLCSETFDADVCVIAEKANSGLNPTVSHPQGEADADGLLSPASLPSIAASRGVVCLVDDRSDVRSAAKSEAPPGSTPVRIKSVMTVPFGGEKVIIAGDQTEGAFAESDLDLLQLISSYATALEEHVGLTPDGLDADDRISEVAFELSHDANNLITVITGRLELLREDSQGEHIDVIERSVQRLKELIEDTTTMLKTGSHVKDIKVVNLSKVIREAWSVVETEQAELATADLNPIMADRSRLSQLLENLFRNAAEHAGSDVSVWVGMLDDDQGFYVEDDGPGIDPDERESVFELGYSGKSEGTGLGLNIVQWIADIHGWDVTVGESDRGGGARFEFSNVDIVS